MRKVIRTRVISNDEQEEAKDGVPKVGAKKITKKIITTRKVISVQPEAGKEA